MRPSTGRNLVNCLSCNIKIDVGEHPEVGQIVTCKNCETEFELIDLDPLTLDWPLDEEDEEDLDYLDEDEDEDFFDDFEDEDDDYDDDDDY